MQLVPCALADGCVPVSNGPATSPAANLTYHADFAAARGGAILDRLQGPQGDTSEMLLTLLTRFERIRGDVRLALRQLIAAPGFTCVAVLTLALGIGINSAIFSLADAALMRPLPFGQADRLVMLWERLPSAPHAGVSPLNMRDWGQQSQSIDAIGAVQRGMGGGPLLTAPDGSVETAERQSVTTNFFDVLGVTPLAGRTFLPEDEGQPPTVVILGEAVWRRRFNSDPAIVGRLVRLNGQPYTVVGVVASAVQFQRPAEIWTLSPPAPDTPRMRAGRFFEVVARLKPGVSIDSARNELTLIADRLAREYPKENKGAGILVEPIRLGIVGSDLQTTSVFLLGVVGFVLLLCCANVANLLLARATARSREIAVRTALGAERGRIIGQLLTESLVLALFGGLLGIGVGAMILEAAPTLIPSGLLPAAVTLAFDSRIVLFALAAAMTVGVIFGVIPAWQATGSGLAGVMASESRSTTSAGSRLRRSLVAGEVAAAVLLLCGAGLLLKTVLTLVGGDTGYRSASESVLTLDFSVPTGKASRYPTPEKVLQFYDTVAREVRAQPEVRRVGWSSSLPYGTGELGDWPLTVVGDPPVADRDRPMADYSTSDPGYFETLDLPIVDGRVFDDRDRLGSVPVCIINEALVRRLFKGRRPIGARLGLGGSASAPAQVREIVGVARQVSGSPDAAEELLQVYVPLAQYPTGDVYMVVQSTTGAADQLTPLVRRVVARVDPDLPVRRDRTLEVLSIQSTAGYRFRATMVGAFAALALVLAMIGVFGVLAYTVQQRQREIGIRMALGATSPRVMWLVFRDAGGMIATGAIIGMALAAVAGQLIATFLFGVDPLDPLTFFSVPVIILLTAILSAAMPAWRASRINPVVAFRHDG
jgi:putative ABC transport system permease protein